jgi:outer membrane protein OmpA-like peptidoglycan-associated protein
MEVADQLRRHRRAPVEVDGYTDTVGSSQYNLGLSQARAQSVADALVREGINPRRIKTQGFGETHLAVQTPDNVHERRNRRVVIRVFPERRDHRNGRVR